MFKLLKFSLKKNTFFVLVVPDIFILVSLHLISSIGMQAMSSTCGLINFPFTFSLFLTKSHRFAKLFPFEIFAKKI